MASDATHDPLSIAYYCTGHGLGHATRSIEVCKHLVERGHSVTVITAAPARVFLREVPSARFLLRKAVLDAGSKQLDPFTVDVKGSLEDYYNTAVVRRDEMLAAEVQWLQSNNFDLVVSDVVPLACTAAAMAGVPAVCVSNFSWDFIYSEYLTTQRRTEFKRLVWQIAQDYSNAALLLRLPGYVPMPAFTAIEDVPLVVRHARKFPAQVREELGLPLDAKLAVLIHGGHKAELRVTEDFLPPGWVCVACNGGRPLSPDTPLPPNFRLAPADVYTPDLVAACDCVIGKIGYGTVSEVLAHGVPLVFVRRDFFNEEPFLRKMLELHGAAVEMKRRDFLEGHWGPYLQRACSLNVRYNEPTNGAEVVAARLEQVARGDAATAPKPNPMTRLRDTVVFGYLMATPKHGRVDVPDWYVNGADPNRRLGSFRNLADVAGSTPGASLDPLLKDWRVIEGDSRVLPHMPDTVAFLQLLRQLDSPHAEEQRGSGGGSDSSSTAGAAAADGAEAAAEMELPEFRAARGLFRWDDELVVTRAPGRLDVMGGIADYSGSLVLQMPIAEACHVALQRHPLAKQQVWKHIKARHDKLGGPRPALRVVSLHADDTNRAPTFDIDLDDLYEPDGSPIPYSSLRAYCKKDPASSWGAYVAGCLLVLAREKGVAYPDGISILVASDVPEGKGASSSAALEVAVMTALAAAHDCSLSSRELAILCQKAENLVVGAPCGVMDQLTSSLGDAGQLLALLCQPAEVQGTTPIPPQVRFWGIDSGIRHSNGGSDYTSVRVGTFMGLKLISEAARRLQRNSSSMHDSSGSGSGRNTSSNPGSSSVAAALTAAVSPLHKDAHVEQQQQQQQGDSNSGRASIDNSRSMCAFGGYLANISPSQYKELFESQLPSHLQGSDFLNLYGPHLDSVTSIDLSVNYALREPTSHPVHENFRVNSFRALLAAADALGDAATAAVVGGGGEARQRHGSVGQDSRPGSSSGAELPPPAAAAAAGAGVSHGGHNARSSMEDLLGMQQLALEHAAATTQQQQHAPGSSGNSWPESSSSSSNGAQQQQQQQQVRLVHVDEQPPAALLGPLETLGELMFQSHASYSACGLGSDGTNRLVNIVREHMLDARKAGCAPALYGAKITGGGCGGTVCVLGLAGSAGQAAVDAVVKQYQAETGYTPFVFAGSSVGAARFGHLRLIRRK
uniref:L-arabinokinase n=1 Tax=Tetradesmus obliquus TaxID=3088 RepID=A0A383W3L1_TETOB|eukprot:jgi/Sobl393_1/14750/SZX71800.1